MVNNRLENERNSCVPPADVELVARAQKRLISLYLRFGNWRSVGKHCGLAHHRYAWELATKGIVPSNPEIRVKIFLPRVMPSGRLPKVKRLIPKIWENLDIYFKKVKK